MDLSIIRSCDFVFGFIFLTMAPNRPKRKAAQASGKAKKQRKNAEPEESVEVQVSMAAGPSGEFREREESIEPPVYNNDQIGPQPLRSFCDSLGLHLSKLAKAKIQNGEFTDLGPLLSPPGAAPPSMNFALIQEGQKLVIGQQLNKPSPVTSIEEWTSAFMIYMSVYLEVHMNRAIEMLKYMDIVRSAANQFTGQGWRTYDIQFRLKQAMNPAHSWAQIDSELWLRVLLTPQPPMSSGYEGRQRNFRDSFTSPFNGSQQQFRASDLPQGVCFALNGKGVCKRINCPFQHRCSKCRKFGHSAIRCQVGQTSGGNGKPTSFPRKVVGRGSTNTNQTN